MLVTVSVRTYRNILCVFFQAEDGIRDIGVTGVQTCALPISRRIGAGLRSSPERCASFCRCSWWWPPAYLRGSRTLPLCSYHTYAQLAHHGTSGVLSPVKVFTPLWDFVSRPDPAKIPGRTVAGSRAITASQNPKDATNPTVTTRLKLGKRCAGPLCQPWCAW